MIVLCASASVHGATAHWFLALSATPISGTLTPRSGIVNVCDARSGFRTRSGLPFTIILPPRMPRGWPRNGLRRPLSPSYWSTVTRTSELAGTFQMVLCTHWPCSFFTR